MFSLCHVFVFNNDGVDSLNMVFMLLLLLIFLNTCLETGPRLV